MKIEIIKKNNIIEYIIYVNFKSILKNIPLFTCTKLKKHYINCFYRFPNDNRDNAYFRFIGKSKCSNKDKFDLKIGKKLAKNRAFEKYNRFLHHVLYLQYSNDKYFIKFLHLSSKYNNFKFIKL